MCADRNGDDLKDVKRGYDAVKVVVIVKLLQGIGLCVLGVTIFCVRAVRKNSKGL